MPVLFKKHISTYLRSFSETPQTQNLLILALFDILQKDQAYLSPINSPRKLREIFDKTPPAPLREQFKARQEQWYAFNQAKAPSREIEKLAHWLETEIQQLGAHYRDGVRAAVRTKIAALRSIFD